MSEDATDEEFGEAAAQVDEAHKRAISELRSKVERAKSEALKRVRV